MRRLAFAVEQMALRNLVRNLSCGVSQYNAGSGTTATTTRAPDQRFLMMKTTRTPSTVLAKDCGFVQPDRPSIGGHLNQVLLDRPDVHPGVPIKLGLDINGCLNNVYYSMGCKRRDGDDVDVGGAKVHSAVDDDGAGSADKGTPESTEGPPGEDVLEKVAANLAQDMSAIFVRQPNYGLYRPDLVLEDRINGRVVEGSARYISQMNLLRIYCHLRFVYVRFRVTSLRVVPAEGTVHMKWQVQGLGALQLCLNYLPKKLYQRKNMEEFSPVKMAGVSVYHVDRDGKVFRHVIDNKEQDQGNQEQDLPVNKIMEKIHKLRRSSDPNPAI